MNRLDEIKERTYIVADESRMSQKELDIAWLIAEVERQRESVRLMRLVPHPEWHHDIDDGPGINMELRCEVCAGRGHSYCGVTRATIGIGSMFVPTKEG